MWHVHEYWLLYLLQFRGDVYSGKLPASIPQAQPDCRDSGSSVPSALHCVGSRLDGGAALPEVAGLLGKEQAFQFHMQDDEMIAENWDLEPFKISNSILFSYYL